MFPKSLRQNSEALENTESNEVKKDLIGWKLGRVITVVDRGFSSEDNLRVLQQTGGHYIAGEKMTSGKPTVEVALAHPGRFKTIRGNLEVKEIIVGDGEARKRYVLVRNPKEAKRDARRGEKHTGSNYVKNLPGLTRFPVELGFLPATYSRHFIYQ